MEWARVERSEIAFIILYKGLQTAIISDLTLFSVSESMFSVFILPMVLAQFSIFLLWYQLI